MKEEWQLYDNLARPIPGKGSSKNDVYTKRLLHGSVHVWMYRINSKNEIEVLLQKRSSEKRTWPDYYDATVGGHINLGEEPLTTVHRETKEEIGLDIDVNNLEFIFSTHIDIEIDSANNFENEFRWEYLYKPKNDESFLLADGEVDSLAWMPIEELRNVSLHSATSFKIVPQGRDYFIMLLTAIERVCKK